MSKLIEITAVLDRTSTVDTWGDETPDLLRLIEQRLKLWHPQATVSVRLGDGYRTDGLVEGETLGDALAAMECEAFFHLDEDVQLAYEMAVERVYTAEDAA